MLSPDQIEAAGDAMAAVYNGIEARMLDHLVAAMLAGDGITRRTVTEIALLAQTHAGELRRIIDDHAGEIDEAVRATAEEMLAASDADDAARAGGEPMWPQQVAATVDGIALVLARDNIQMVEGAKQAFLSASIEAVTLANTGMATAERALHRAVRKLEREGVSVITYQDAETGRVTVRNKVDVAVRRHVRTQIAQDGARMTERRMGVLGVTLVEVSSHCDSRPEHRPWQGRCYSLVGDVEIEGVRYPDFYAATGYGSVDGLMGANCRHSFGPYRHGATHAYEPDPKHPSGLPGEEVYRLEQRQRALERRIREAKREVRGAQQAYDALGDAEGRAGLAKAKDGLKRSQAAMRGLIADANAASKTGAPVLHRKPAREWAGDMPRVRSMAQLAAEGKVSRKERGDGYSEDYAVRRRVVNGAAYKARFGELGLPKRAAETAHQQAMRILEDRDGTAGERLCAISWRTGELVADTFGRPPADFASGFAAEQVDRIDRVPGGVVLLHNHPASGPPSATDICTLAKHEWARASVIVCHDGAIYLPRVLREGVVEAYNEIINDVRGANPAESDSKAVEKMAQDALYLENEEAKWFKITRR